MKILILFIIKKNCFMKVFASKQIKDIDAYTIKHEPIASLELMERAAVELTDWIACNYYYALPFKIFIGPGNNGGDGLVVARLLCWMNIPVEVLLCSEKRSTDAEENLKKLREQDKAVIKVLNDISKFPDIPADAIIVDGLFGSGLTRPLEGLPAEIVKKINQSGCEVLAIDIPSGLFGEDNSNNNRDAIIKATHTLSFQFPKLSFFFPENESFVGEWHVLDIGLHPEAIKKTETPYHYLTKDNIRPNLEKRKKFSHKGNFGHALLISGSYGKMGAAILAAKACLKTGAGLVTCHIPKKGYNIMQTKVPEAMVSIDPSDTLFSETPPVDNYDVIGIGPGIGTDDITQKAFKKLLDTNNKPLVIDADGLNILSKNKKWLNMLPEGSILTPHPKEFERLAGETSGHYSRLQLQKDFSKKYNIYVVLKNAHTSITCPDGRCYFNATGNPGMATAGSGDVLTGIILALAGQYREPEKAALTGVYLHGLAGDLAEKKYGQEALIASDIIKNTGKAFKGTSHN